jgi:hypothetical protein
MLSIVSAGKRARKRGGLWLAAGGWWLVAGGWRLAAGCAFMPGTSAVMRSPDNAKALHHRLIVCIEYCRKDMLSVKCAVRCIRT